MKEISKQYQPTHLESKWYSYWQMYKLFSSTPDEREPYTIVIPPPNVTGILHMGHMLNNTIQDVLIRRKRMEGFNACWVPGTDHASIATEAKVVKMLKEQGIDKEDLSREEFLEHAFKWKDKYGGIILSQLKKLGASCDWDRTHFTMDDNYYKSVIKVFVDLHNKGLIYRGIRMVNWDPKAQTAVSDEEVIYKDVQSQLYYVNYPIKDSDEFITIATTRPETIMADVAIAISPGDPRYIHLLDKKAIVPFSNREVPIIEDSYIDPEFGTGCLKVTPAHDINDYEIGQRHNLEVIDILNPDGTLNEAGAPFTGVDREKARKMAAKSLKEMGLLVKAENMNNSVGYSERTNAAIEPRLSLQWFVKMKDMSKEAFESVMDDEIQLVPAKFKNTYRHWMENIRDWCISRQLWWGQRIPAYYLPNGKYVVGETPEEALAIAQKEFNDPSLKLTDLKQDEDVLDTWFSSWLWPIEVFKGITEPDNPEINYYYPTNDLVTAPEILFFWVARMAMAGFQYMGKKPFNNVYLTGIVRDDLRRKMSKSLGNSPDPLDLIEKYGADGVRTGMLFCSPAGNDLLFKESLCEQGRNFANKIWNAYRLIMSWEGDHIPATEMEEAGIKWMTERINIVKKEQIEQYKQFRISEILMGNYKIIWNDFCSWYLEMVKPPKGGKISQFGLVETKKLFEEVIKMLHPFMPFVTEEIWHTMLHKKNGSSIMMEPIGEPKAKVDEVFLSEMELIMDTISETRRFRMDKKLGNKIEIPMAFQTEQQAVFEKYEMMVRKFCNPSEISFTSEAIPAAPSYRVGKTTVFIPLEEAVNVEEEMEKIQKEIDYTNGFLKSVMKKLDNEKFVSNAPPKVIEIERQKQGDAEAKLKMLKESLKSLQS